MSEFVYLGIQIYLRSFSRWGQKKIWVNENDAKSFFARQSVCWLSSVFCEKRRISSLLTVTMERQKSTYHASKWISQLCLSLLTDDLKCTATRRRKKGRLSHVACEFNNSLAVCEQRNNDAMEFSFDKQPVMGERSHSRARTHGATYGKNFNDDSMTCQYFFGLFFSLSFDDAYSSSHTLVRLQQSIVDIHRV